MFINIEIKQLLIPVIPVLQAIFIPVEKLNLNTVNSGMYINKITNFNNMRAFSFILYRVKSCSKSKFFYRNAIYLMHR